MKKKEIREWFDKILVRIDMLEAVLSRKIICEHKNKVVVKVGTIGDYPAVYQWYCPDCNSYLNGATEEEYLECEIDKYKSKNSENTEKILELEKAKADLLK